MNACQQMLRTQPIIEFDAESHTYYVDGAEQISVTTALKAAGIVDASWFTEYGRWRGSAVHRAAELYFHGNLDRRTLDPAVKPRIAQLEKFVKDTRFVAVHIEHAVCDPVYGYAGMLDLAGYFEGEDRTADASPVTTIIDLKNYGGGLPAWVRLQIAAYGHALDPYRIFRRVAVNLADDSYQCEDYSLASYLDDVNDFLAALRVARWQQRNR